MFKRRTSGSISARDAALEMHRLRHQQIEPISLTIRRGEVFGLVGPTGSGKSTVIDLLSGRKAPIAGAISILGYDSQRDARQARKRVGVVLSSDPNTPGESGTPREHLHFHARLIGMSERLARRRIPHVLAIVGLARYEHLQVSAFSPSCKQRLALARALLHEPLLLLLDEPTHEIEAHERAAFWELLLVLRAQGKTILLATRDWEEASVLCDRVAHLSQGKLQAVWKRAAQKDTASEQWCSRAAKPD